MVPAMKTASPNQLCTRLEFLEIDGDYAPDFRRLMRDERNRLVVAMRTGDGAKIKAAAEEARRVAKMWGVDL